MRVVCALKSAYKMIASQKKNIDTCDTCHVCASQRVVYEVEAGAPHVLCHSYVIIKHVSIAIASSAS